MTNPPSAAPPAVTPPGRPRSLVVVLAVVSAIALLAIGAGLAVATGLGADRLPGERSVDAGFARDMATHHVQATEMAQIARDGSTDPEVRLTAFDIETQQLNQVGQLRGWLQSWGLTGQSAERMMSWMGHSLQPGELMPGMATSAELAKLRALTGRPLDVYFLQLMIRHHRGGFEMAQAAAARAEEPYVRDLATKIAQGQQAEVVTMEQMLRERGGQPLS
jgi:uncharacterized protein (DUF305 family)